MCAGKTYCGCGCGPSQSGLGLTATQKRPIRSGHQYDKYFPKSDNKTHHFGEGNQKKTLQLMERWARKFAHQTKELAHKELKGRNLIVTLSNIWHFLYNHVQYTQDQAGVEQLRTPARVWADRTRGVDCDCYSIFISTVLHNLGIPHAFRMAKYDRDWQHVYVVVPKNGKKTGLQHRPDYYVIDPVKDQFNDEHPFTQKHDRFMNTMPITGLSGLGQTDCTPTIRPIYDTVQAIERDGNIVAEKLLKTLSVPYQSKTTDKGEPVLLVPTADSRITAIPTVLTHEEADTVKKIVTGGGEVTFPGGVYQPGGPGIQIDHGNRGPENKDTDPVITTTTDNNPAAQDGSDPLQAGFLKSGWFWAALLTAGGLWYLHENRPSKAVKPKAKKGLGKVPTIKI